jgi:hypothetical protein
VLYGMLTLAPRLKDSDVTWLYGPLHTADPTPKPSPSAAAALDLSSSPSPMLDCVVRKPILKHRSICEQLTSEFPFSPVLSPPESEEDDGPQILSDGGGPPLPHKPIRPSLLHTKSDTHITRLGPDRAFRRDSPPRVAPNDLPPSSLLQSESPPSSVVPGQKRKHISFNTFVEQCIAIDKPKKKRPHFSTSNPHLSNFDDDGYDEDSEDGIIDEVDEILFDDDPDNHPDASYSHPHPPHHSPPPHNVSPPSSSTSEEDDDDDDVLQIRVRHPTSVPSPIPRSPTHSASSTSSSSSHSRPPKARSASYAPPGRRGHSSNGFLTRSQSTDKELVTIALIAPTILKTRMDDDDEHSPYPLSHTHLSSYTRRPRDPHNGNDWSTYGAHDSPVELVYVPPSYVYSAREESEDTVEEDRQTAAYDPSQSQLFDQPMVASPPSVTQVQQEHNVDSIDPSQLLGPGVDPSIPRRAEGASTERSPAGPEVIVSSSDGRPGIPRSRSRSGSRSRSRSRTPSPNDTMTVSTNIAPSYSATVVPRPNAPAQATGSIFLAPSDPAPSRGRTASSSSVSSQTQVEQSRGRSATRTPSFSDRESLNAGSPEGNVGLSIGSFGVRDRERDVRVEKEGGRERGRDRGTRRSHSGSGSHSSLSPEDPHATARIAVEQPQPEQLPVPEVRQKCISGSRSSGSSAAAVVPARSPPRLVLDAKPITQTSYTEAPSTSIPISPGCAQEEQESISRQPAPANSPVCPIHSSPSPSKSSPRPPIVHERRTSFGSSRSPTRDGSDDGQQGTLVGRAVEIMSNAGAFLGSFWHNGAPPGVSTS